MKPILQLFFIQISISSISLFRSLPQRIKGFIIFWPVMETKPHQKLYSYLWRVNLAEGELPPGCAREPAAYPEGLRHMKNAREHAAIWRSRGRAALGESMVYDFRPSQHHRVLVRLCFGHFAEYRCLLSHLSIRVKRGLFGLLLVHILNYAFL